MMMVPYYDIVMTNPCFLSRVMMTTTVQQSFFAHSTRLCIILFSSDFLHSVTAVCLGRPIMIIMSTAVSFYTANPAMFLEHSVFQG